MKEATWNASIVSDAVRNGDLKTLRWFFDRGCPTDLALNQNGDTALLIACRLGLLDVARLALLYNARNDPHPDYGNTALQHAVSSGHGSIVELILDCAAPSGCSEVIVNHTDANGEAPIHVASRCGSVDILTLLMMHGANVGVVDARGRTCLHLAAQQGQVACLLCVLEVGGDEFMEVRDDEGWKCLDLSIRANKMECVQVLLQTGAKVSADAIELATKKPKVLKLLLEYTADTDGSIDTEEDEISSGSIESRGGTIFSGLDTFIASPELRQFRTPLSTEDKIDREEEEEIDMERDHQFSQNDETWTIYFTEDGYRYFYNNDRDYSTWDDPRSKRVLFGQQQTQSVKKLPPASPSVNLSSGSGHTHKEVRVKPTTIAKPFLSAKEVPPEETKITNPLEAAASDPKSILFAQIRSRRNKESSSSESSTDDMKSNNPNPKREQPEVNPTDPKSILLAQIKARERKSTDKEIDTSKPGMKADTASNDALLKYRKMKTVGVPLPAILQRMSRDGVCNSAIQMFQQQMTNGEESTLPSQLQVSSTKVQTNEVVVTSPAKSTTQQKEDLLKDKSLMKYVQMKKVGVPVAAVAMKMSQDGIDDKQINSFRVAYGLDSSGKKTPKQLPAPPHRRSSKAMQKVHVSTIKEEKLRNSLWALSSQIDAEISQKEVEELESLFSASPRPSAKTAIGSKRGEGVRPAKQSSAMIIESKRANNLAISLAQYRAFSNFDDLVTAVVSLDESNLDAERVNNMTSLIPTTSELKQLKQLNGQVDGLGRAELFFLAVAKMKHFKEKLFSFCYLLQFDDQMKTLTTSLLTLEKACTEVITSKPLAFVCKKLLKIGNLMNGQSATGITLNSLINIAKKKGGSGGKISVIDHLISTSDNCDAMSFKHDMPTLREGTRLDLGEIKLSLRELESGLKSIDSTIKAEQSLMDSQDERPKHSVNFLSRITPFQQRAVQELKTMTDLIERLTSRVDELKRFFAEEPTSTSASIFEALLEFSFIVETSKEAHHRKQRALRRRDSMQRPRTAHL
eukprot:scaffold4781_cov141-Skeletonema_marinoi.AAC.6